jgi:hypothetical protein
VKNSLAKTNVGPWTTFTKHGGIVITFGMPGRACPGELCLMLTDSHRCRRRRFRVHPRCLCQPAREGRLLEPRHRWPRCGRRPRSQRCGQLH